NQSVAKLWQEDGTWSGLFRHVLKVFLLDADHQVRNIYSAGLFNPQLVLNDVETVLLEADKRSVTDRQQCAPSLSASPSCLFFSSISASLPPTPDSAFHIPHSAFPSALLFPILDSALRFGLALPLAMHSALLSVFLPPSLFPTIIP